MSQAESLNIRVAAAPPSATFRMMDRVAARLVSGKEVLDLSSGESDFDTPEHVREAAYRAMQAGATRYTQVAGMQSLREAVAEKFKRENGLATDWQQVIVSNGGKQVIFNALAATINDGDEVIIPAPYWVSYPGIVQLAGGAPVEVACTEESGFKLTAPQLEAAITQKTRWLLLNSPNNPSGAVYTAQELRGLAAVLARFPRVMVLSDDIYEHLTYRNGAFATLASVSPELAERVLTVNGVSKSYAMTGWRIGYGSGPRWLINAMVKLQGQQTSGACTISQHAALTALTGPQDFVSKTREVFRLRRDRLVEVVNAVPGLSCSEPDGAFYIFANCKKVLGTTSVDGAILRTDEDIATALLEDAGLATVHGSAFGAPGFLRIGFSYSDETLTRAAAMLRSFFEQLTVG
ncbi:pyridoxal phosphate-dependent aminotransferase [Paraburkholderia caledonica]|uniref:Aminotransferase n=1 Tax=Paraburkholderia caledonica TaxID=134536 RepID=A0AB73IML0_9BURK|nr:aspartate aminotransferase [Paraburkholderia caledonica]